MLTALLRKAVEIRERKEHAEKSNLQYLVVPNSTFSSLLSRTLRPTGMIIVNDTGKKIGHLVKKTTVSESKTSVVYKIPCNGCDSAYYGETSRGLPNRVREHKADIRHHRDSNAFVNHLDIKGHLPDWKSASILEQGLRKQQRKVIESLYIATNVNINKRAGDLKWTKATASYAVQEWSPKNGRGPDCPT